MRILISESARASIKCCFASACSHINQWSENEKGLYLAVALRGQAQGILGDLPIDKQQDYKSLVKALEERFAPLYQIPCQQYCLLQLYVNMSGLPSLFVQFY
jgi:hypothetical protein